MENTENSQSVATDNKPIQLIIIAALVIVIIATVIISLYVMRGDKADDLNTDQDQTQNLPEDGEDDLADDQLDISSSEPEKAIDDTIEELDKMIDELDGEDIEDGSDINME